MSDKLPKSWPPSARRILLEAARYYYEKMVEPFAVPEVAMEWAIEQANRDLERDQRSIYEEATDRWINRWESGKLDEEMKKAIEATYSRLRRAERGIRGGARKKIRGGGGRKSPRQLDSEIASALSEKRR